MGEYWLSLQYAHAGVSTDTGPDPTQPTPVPVGPGTGSGFFPHTPASGSSTKLALAHYFPPYPLQLTTDAYPSDWYATKYLVPGGDPSNSAPYGGLLRDRPLPPGPLTGDWALRNAETEVQQAMSVGINGFVVDILNATTNGSNNNSKFTNAIFAAAALHGPFTCAPMLDVSRSLASQPDSAIAAAIVHYATYASAQKVGSKYVVSAFKGEALSAARWSNILTLATIASGGKEWYFVPCMLSPSAVDSGAYDGVADGYGVWGNRYATGNSTATGPGTPKARIADVQSRGKIWMQPVSLQDSRPNQSKYYENEGTKNLRNTWDIAIDGDADWVQFPTWNDYSENAHICPSLYHGWTFLDMQAYYIQWFRLGSPPAITQDCIFVTHRRQLTTATPSYPGNTDRMVLDAGTANYNRVEALCFLTAAGDVTLTVGGTTQTFALGSGISVVTIQLGLGMVSAKLARGGSTVVTVSSPHEVLAHPYVQDLQYVGVSSLRTGVRPTTPMPPTTGGGFTKTVFVDDFLNTAVDEGKWNIRTDTQSNHSGRNFRKAVSVNNGILSIRSGTDNTIDPGSKPWVSGYLDTIGKYSWDGEFRVEGRLRMPWGSTAYGYWPALWLRPDDGGLGEIDIMEGWPQPNDLHQTLHYDYVPTYPHEEGPHSTYPTFDPRDWHVYAVEKRVGEMKFYIDTTLVWTANSTNVPWYAAAFDRPVKWNIRLQLQIGGSYGGNPTGGTVLSQTFDTDWIRVLTP